MRRSNVRIGFALLGIVGVCFGAYYVYYLDYFASTDIYNSMQADLRAIPPYREAYNVTVKGSRFPKHHGIMVNPQSTSLSRSDTYQTAVSRQELIDHYSTEMMKNGFIVGSLARIDDSITDSATPPQEHLYFSKRSPRGHVYECQIRLERIEVSIDCWRPFRSSSENDLIYYD